MIDGFVLMMAFIIGVMLFIHFSLSSSCPPIKSLNWWENLPNKEDRERIKAAIRRNECDNCGSKLGAWDCCDSCGMNYTNYEIAIDMF